MRHREKGRVFARACMVLAVTTTAIAAGAARADHMVGMPPAAAHQTQPMTFRKVADDLWFLYDDKSSNSLVLMTEAGSLVVDTKEHPAEARDLLARIAAAGGKPPRWAINSHFHGDHMLGNTALRAAGATILAHRDTAIMMSTHIDYEIGRRQAYFQRNGLDPKEVRLAMPDVTFDSQVTLELGGRKVEVYYWGAGQNPGDTVILFPHARAAFLGGFFGRRSWPNMAFTPSVDSWIALLRKAATLDADLFIPGHGDIGTKQDLLDEAKLLEDTQAAVKDAIARGLPREAIVKTVHMRQYSGLRQYERLHDFLESLYLLYTTGRPRIALPK